MIKWVYINYKVSLYKQRIKGGLSMCTKRWIAAVLAAALAVMMLAGCDGSSSSSSSSDSGNSSGGNNSSSSSSSSSSGGSHDSSSSSGIFDSTDGKLDVSEVNRMLKVAKSEITCASSTEVDQFVNAFADKVKATKEADFSINTVNNELSQEAAAKLGNDKRRKVAILTALESQAMGYSTIERAAAEEILLMKNYTDPMPKEITLSGYKVHTQGGPQYWILCLTWADASNAPDAGSQASR